MSQISTTDSDELAKRIVTQHYFPGASSVAIERVLSKGVLRSVPNGEEICSEGDPGNEFFFLLRGHISVMRRDITGTNRVLSNTTSPAVFGHMAVIDGSKRSATCVANGPVEVVVLQRSQLDRMITEDSVAGIALRRLLIASLCDQLSSANGFVRKIVFDHGNSTAESQQPTKPPARPVSRRGAEPTNTTEDLQTVSAMLGGWANDLADLEKVQGEVTLVMDEDMKRTNQAQKKR
jgi:CRP/FNR family cyclic AMP-dependent transcriptional regulator